MIRHRSIVGLCMLCALLVSAFAAQSASAATNGTTAFTCKVEAGGTFKGAHCLTTGSGSPSKHVEIAENETTELTGSNANTAEETTAARPWITKATIAGVPLEIVATVLDVSGTLVNKKAASGEHYTSGTFTLTKTGVTVNKPVGKGCKVFTDKEVSPGPPPVFGEGEEGVIHSKELKFTTEGQGDFVKIEPVTGSVISTFWITCNKGEVPEALEGTYTTTGSFKCPTSGATIVCSHEETTAQNTLKIKGSKLGLEGALTFTARKPGDFSFTPITATTVATP